MTSERRRPDPPAGPVSVGRLMARLMARSGYDRERAADMLDRAWAESVPAALRGVSRPGLVNRGVLDVFLTHSVHVQEIGFHKRAIVERLRQLAPGAGVTDLRCRLAADAGSTT